MRIVHLISSLERGGAQAVLYDLVQGLASKGYEQSVIYFHNGPYKEKFKALGVVCYQIQGWITPFDLKGMYQLYKLLKTIKPTCLHTLLWAANWMGRIVTWHLKIPVIAALHNNYHQNGQLRNFLDRLVPFGNKAIIAVSHEVKESFSRLQRVSCPIIVIHNGINYRELQRPSPLNRQFCNFLPEDFIIGSVGRFVPIKRYPLLLESFAQLFPIYPQLRLLLIGAGPEEKRLRTYAYHLGIGDAITWVIDTPAYPYYPLMDCFVLTSPQEGISIALLEAMSCGVACLVTAPLLQHPVLENMRNGIVVSTNNATLLSEKLVLLITNNAMRKSLGFHGQQTVQNRFDHTIMINAYDRLFQATCKITP